MYALITALNPLPWFHARRNAPSHLRGLKPLDLSVEQLYRDLFDEANLERAFAWLCEQTQEASEHRDVWEYRRNWTTRKAGLRQDLKQGAYHFHTVSVVEVRNDQGELERREIRSAEDRLVIRAMAQVMQPVLQPALSEHCTHLQGHGGLHQAVRDTQEYIASHPGDQVIKSDVKGYYAHIDHGLLAEQLRQLLPGETRLHNLLWEFMRRTTEFGGNYTDVERGLPLGASLSPLLGGVYLSPLDDLARETGGFYRRYMDDWVWVLPGKTALRHAIKAQYAVLQALRVETHPDKTFIGKVAKGFDFLGFHCCPTGMRVSDTALSRRDKKIARLYEQGASKRRIGRYLVRWLGWAACGLCSGAAHAQVVACAMATGSDNTNAISLCAVDASAQGRTPPPSMGAARVVGVAVFTDLDGVAVGINVGVYVNAASVGAGITDPGDCTALSYPPGSADPSLGARYTCTKISGASGSVYIKTHTSDGHIFDSYSSYTDNPPVPNNITASASPPAGGSVTCVQPLVDLTYSGSCTATANTGYTFASWSGSGSGTVANCDSELSATCAVSGVSSAATLTANFTLNTYPVGGTVTGLGSNSVVLQDNNGDDLTVSANGAFTFATPVAYGSPYAVTVSTQPTGETCSVSSGTGTVSAAVSDVSVSCATSTYAFATTTGGTGAGSVAGSTANGTYDYDTPIVLAASANPGSSLTGWSPAGCVNGFHLTSDTTCTANFALNTYTFATAMSGAGSGTVTGSTGSGTYNYNTPITLTASANPGSTFTGWSPAGCVSGFPLTSNTTCTANFTLNTYAITAAASPVAGGSVSCSPNPVDYNGSSTCTATPSAGYSLGNWSGDCTGTTCKLTGIQTAKSVTANFTASTYAITTTTNPAAGGTVTCSPNPVDYNGSSTCTATANTGYSLGNWSGDCTGATCNLSNIQAAKSVTANFTLATASQSGIPTRATGVTATLAVNGCASIANAAFIDAPAGAPNGASFPYGLLGFTLNGCVSNAPVTVTVTYSQALAAGAGTFYKYQNGSYAAYPATFGTSSVSYTLTDGGSGDADGAVNSSITDPAGIAAASQSIPTLSEWGMLILASLLLALGGTFSLRRQLL